MGGIRIIILTFLILSAAIQANSQETASCRRDDDTSGFVRYLSRETVKCGTGKIPVADSQKGSCSAFQVCPRVVLTAAHCLIGQGRNAIQNIRYSPTCNSQKSLKASALILGTYDLDDNLDKDWAVIVLSEENISSTYFRLPASPHTEEVTGKTLYAIGHPRDANGKLEIAKTICHVKGIDKNLLLSCMLKGGYSGGPLFETTSGTTPTAHGILVSQTGYSFLPYFRVKPFGFSMGSFGEAIDTRDSRLQRHVQRFCSDPTYRGTCEEGFIDACPKSGKRSNGQYWESIMALPADIGP